MNRERKFILYGVIYSIVLLLVQFIFFYRGTPAVYNLSGNGINLIPFRTLTHYIKYYDHFNRVIIIKQIISCFALLPLSIVLGFCSKSKTTEWKKCLLYFLFVSILISFLSRLAQVGVFEIDHVIFRTIIGFGSFYLFKNCFKKFNKYATKKAMQS